MPAKEKNALPSIPREIFVLPDREITVDPSGKKFPFFILDKGQLSCSLTKKNIGLI